MTDLSCRLAEVRPARPFGGRVWQVVALTGLLLLGLCLDGRAFGEESKPHPLAGTVLVLYNPDAPGSEELARVYQQARGIPENQVIGLSAPLTEEISREEYDRTLREPLRKILEERGLWVLKGGRVVQSRVRYAVLMRGMPLKIRNNLPPRAEGVAPDPLKDHDEASVDSELCLAGVDHELRGAVNNPYFRSFSPVVEASFDAGALLVTRLDGPDDATVRRVIADSLAAEKLGVWGWAWVDARGLTSGPYAQGDEWLNAAAEAMRRQGIPTAVERTEATLPRGLPLQPLAVYYGWYVTHVNGPFADPDTRFVRGGIGVHIHSFSASTLRNAGAHWAAPLLARGAAVTAGNVYEPYLGLTLHLDLFQDRLMSGFCVADAAYAAMPVLSWMGVVLGDPLYRPYAVWQNPPGNSVPPDEWQQYREALVRSSFQMALAVPKLVTLADRLQNPMPLEAVGCWQFDLRNYPGALRSFRDAEEMARQPWQKLQINWWILRTMGLSGKKREAAELARKLFALPLTEAQQKLVLSEIELLEPKPTPPPGVSPQASPRARKP